MDRKDDNHDGRATDARPSEGSVALLGALDRLQFRCVAEGVAPSAFDELRSLAGVLAATEERLQLALTRSSVLAEVSRSLAEATDDEAPIDVIVRDCALHIGDGCTVRLVSDDGHWIEPSVCFHRDAEWVGQRAALMASGAFDASEGFSERALRTSEGFLLGDVTMEALRATYKPECQAFFERWPISSLVVAPLRARGRVLGVISLSRTSPGRRYTVDDLVLLQDIADRAALAIANVRLFLAERAAAVEAARTHEHFLDSIIENLPDMVFVKDAAELRFVRFNRAGEDLLGYDRKDLLGKNDYDFFPRSEADSFTSHDRTVLAGRVIVDIPSEPVHTRLKGTRTLHTKKIPLMSPDGAPLFLLGISRDVTEYEQMRAALVQSEKLASLGMLSAGIAHEINNPLAYVAGNLHVIERDAKALVGIIDAYEVGREGIARVESAVAARVAELGERADLAYIRENLAPVVTRTRDGLRRITRIVDALRNLARNDRPEVVPTDLPELASTTMEVIRGRLSRRGIEVVLAWDPNPTVYCVPTLLSQVLLNLLTNAMYAVEAAHPNGGGRIRLASRSSAAEVSIEVSDNGGGIEKDHIAHVFDPFFTTKPVGEGTGLGLSITHNIVASHGGRIEVESAPGEGTCFRIHLPLPPPAGDK